ncbi:MAG: hypothetical protein RRA34_06935, partial [Candidatus Calditenuis sp.]|nr:hypothetical protein [Candidatus Calditenuis sp.]
SFAHLRTLTAVVHPDLRYTLTHLMYSRRAHESAARALLELAERKCGGRILAFGGGGYNPVNVGEAWSAVVEVLAGI